MRLHLGALAAGFGFWLAAAAGAMAQTGDLQITNAWARATPGAAQTAAAYVTIISTTGDRLTGASTPVAQKAELHTMTMDGNVMKMRQVDGIDLPAGQGVTLKPGGYHIMLTGLAQPLTEGQTFPLTLTFDKAGTREVTVTVQKVGSMGPGMDMPMHH
ncbi:MAG TPA: copper chaperone PCu(A)C [Stellaceae bacterium]|nr:copper chaperone PCu(A)C [Stellaceae bacterium]